MGRIRLAAIVLLSLITTALAFAAEPLVKARLTVDGKVIPLPHVYAFTSENGFDEKKADVMLLFTDQPVPADAIEHNSKLRYLASEGKFRGVLISIDDQKQPYSTEVYQQDVMHQGSGNALYLFDAKKFDRKSVAGSIRTSDEKEWKDHEWSFAAEFETPVLDLLKAPAGKALPAGGGDPMKAYTAYQAALMSGDLKSLRKLVSADRAEQMNDPQFKEMLPIVQMMQPKQIAYVSGVASASKAVLTMSASNPGETMTGTITMLMEGGQWKVAEESWRSKSE